MFSSRAATAVVALSVVVTTGGCTRSGFDGQRTDGAAIQVDASDVVSRDTIQADEAPAHSDGSADSQDGALADTGFDGSGRVDAPEADFGGDASPDQGWPEGLLAFFSATSQWGTATDDTLTTLYLAWASGSPCASSASVGRSQTHVHGASGEFAFNPSNEDHFAAFVACLTNNQDDKLEHHMRLLPGISAAARWIWEDEFMPVSPDLVGCSIDEVRLVLHSLSITRDKGFTSIKAEYDWQFWGECE